MPETMQYVHLAGSGRVEVREALIPEPGRGEALVRIAVSAICGSELPTWRRDGGMGHPGNPGHEMAGMVAKGNGLCRVQEGQRVGIQVMSGCGHCIYCLQGDPKHCVNGADILLGAHSEYVVAPEMCLVPLPDDLGWEAAVLLCGDELGTPYHALKRMGGVQAAQVAALFGFGPIGMGFLTWLKFYGARTIVTELYPYRRELASCLGADLALDPAGEDVVARIRQETGGGADLCLDCSHAPETLNDALDAARIDGRVGWVGEKAAAAVKPSGQVIHKELRMTGSWYFTVGDFYEELELYRRGLSLTGLVTHRYALPEAAEAYRLFAAGETGKVLFVHDEVVQQPSGTGG
jgi:threonine dehydrogenase-like Zn-dependent dehydrogenase